MVGISALGLPAPVTHNGLFLPAFVTIIAALAEDTAPRWLSAPWLVRLGDASYALYLLHVPLLLYVAGASARRTGTNALEHPVVAAVVVAVIVVVSVVVHHVVERRRR
jgi:peptidoglycan/LPS O-acetylase OafA/YrhL